MNFPTDAGSRRRRKHTKSASDPKPADYLFCTSKRLGRMAAWTAALIFSATLACSPWATAQTAPNAEAVYSGFLSAYLVQSAIGDHWYRTYSPSARVLITQLLNTFVSTNKSSSLAAADFSWDTWDDDIGWATIAFIRSYAITGNATF